MKFIIIIIIISNITLYLILNYNGDNNYNKDLNKIKILYITLRL
jgi:hypothetical protein